MPETQKVRLRAILDVSIVFDFDFHSNNHFSFNAWQLERFTKINPKKYPKLNVWKSRGRG